MDKDNLMANKFFCSAESRPKFCYLNSNACCLHCEHVEKCILNIKEYNAQNTIKSPLPCTEKIISPNELCEFAC